MFISMIRGFLGDEVWWKALEQTRDKSVVFLMGGTRGWGVLVEMHGQQEQDGWVHSWGFRHEPQGSGVVVQMEYIAHRWDPWLYADRTGDRSLVEGPASRRYKLQGRKDWELGRDRDQCRTTVLPKATSQPTLAGIPVVAIESLLEIYAAEQGLEDAGVTAVEPDAVEPWEKEMLLGMPFPVVD